MAGESGQGQRLAGVPLYLMATRLPFLSVTLVGAGLGLALAVNRFDAGVGLGVVAIVLALLLHAGVNLINDWADDLNGTDRINEERVSPFTGGSRLIQEGVVTLEWVRRYALALFAATIAGGLALIAVRGVPLFAVGLAGVVLGYGYSVAPLRLNTRGLGEPTVIACFALLPVGAWVVAGGSLASAPWLAAIAYGTAVMMILYVNQFPDWRADAATGKRHWVVRLGRPRASRLLLVWIGLVYLVQGFAILRGELGVASVATIVCLPIWLQASSGLVRFAEQPGKLAPTLQRTILATNLYGVVLVGTAWF